VLSTAGVVLAAKEAKFETIGDFEFNCTKDGQTCGYMLENFDTQKNMKPLNAIKYQLKKLAETVKVDKKEGNAAASNVIEDVLKPKQRMLVVTLRADQTLVGVAVATESSRQEGSFIMQLIMVHQDHRKRRLSQVLLDEMQLRFMPAQGDAEILVTLLPCMKSEAAIALFKRNGFQFVDDSGNGSSVRHDTILERRKKK